MKILSKILILITPNLWIQGQTKFSNLKVKELNLDEDLSKRILNSLLFILMEFWVISLKKVSLMIITKSFLDTVLSKGFKNYLSTFKLQFILYLMRNLPKFLSLCLIKSRYLLMPSILDWRPSKIMILFATIIKYILTSKWWMRMRNLKILYPKMYYY